MTRHCYDKYDEGYRQVIYKSITRETKYFIIYTNTTYYFQPLDMYLRFCRKLKHDLFKILIYNLSKY